VNKDTLQVGERAPQGATAITAMVKAKKFTLTNPEIRIEPTNACNAKCTFCPREKMERRQGIMNMDFYRRVIDEAVEAGAKKVSLENYGETFLDPHIFERAAYAKSKGMETLTITNASLLNDEKSRKILELFDVIRISMYGMTKTTYEKIHVRLHFETVRNNTDRLIELRGEMNSKTKIQMYFLLLEENKDELEDWLKKYEPIASSVAVWKPHNWGNGRNYREVSNVKTSCNRPQTGPLQVQWNGTIVPCCFDYDSKILLGDLTKQTIGEVFRSREYEDLRNAHNTGNYSKFPFCEGCDQLNKREDVLVYTNNKEAKVGATNTTFFNLQPGK
jgi:radical SAM protein with 4Fe4S-binding SPASM domain